MDEGVKGKKEPWTKKMNEFTSFDCIYLYLNIGLANCYLFDLYSIHFPDTSSPFAEC